MAMAERKQFPSEQQDQYMLRFPKGMRDRLKAEAEKNKRSLNSEIIARLDDSLLTEQLTTVADESAIKPPTAKELKRLAELIVILERNALDEKEGDRLEKYHEEASSKPRNRKPKP